MASTNAKKALAKEFYIRSSLSVAEIAAQTKQPVSKIYKWIKDGGWDILKEITQIGHDKIVADLMAEVQEINEFIKSQPIGERFADKNIATARNQIINGIQSMQKNLSIGQYVSVMLEFIQFMSIQQNMDLSKVKELATAFLQQKAE